MTTTGEGGQPTTLLICCEGDVTEPTYFEVVKHHRRITKAQAIVKIVGGEGQHLTLIKNSVGQRDQLAKLFNLHVDDIETWAVCDKDTMQCTLQELEAAASKNNILLAFSNPNFEIFVLQHLKFSATNANGHELKNIISKELKRQKIAEVYDKTDLSWLYPFLDKDPTRLDFAIKNSNRISDPENTPHLTVHNLLARLLEFEVGR